MSQWQEEPSNDWEGGGSSKTDDFDFSAPGPSKAFAPLKEQHDDGYSGADGGYGAGAGDDTCRK